MVIFCYMQKKSNLDLFFFKYSTYIIIQKLFFILLHAEFRINIERISKSKFIILFIR